MSSLPSVSAASQGKARCGVAQPSARGVNWLFVIGLILLIFWSYWWSLNLIENRLVGASRTWVPWWHFLGLDFYHNYLAVNHWLAGGDPSVEQFGDPLEQLFTYPPIVLLIFSWCGLVEAGAATRIWFACSAAMFALAAAACVRSRRELGLWPVPAPLGVGVILLSTPVMFALERGNYDVLVLLLLVLAARALRGGTRWGQAAAGWAMGVAVFAKLYPLFALPVLVLLRRPRALAWAVGACAVMGAAFLRGNVASFENQRLVTAKVTPFPYWFGHSISGAWDYLAEGSAAGVIPGMLASAALLLPLALYVGRALHRSVTLDPLLLPALLFFTSVTTFWVPISNDYKLIFLPLAALATWDRKDPWLVHALLLPAVVYLQPFRLPLDVWPLLIIKAAALFGVGISLACKAQRLLG